MVIGNAGENWEEAVKAAGGSAPGETPKIASGTQAQVEKASATAVSKRAKKLAESEVVDVRGLTGTGPGGRIIEQDVLAVLATRPALTQAAKDELRKQIAAGGGSALSGGGSAFGGRFNAADVAAWAGSIAGQTAAGGGSDVAGDIGGAGAFTDSPIKGIRKVISNQMMASHTNTAAFTLNASVSAVALQKLRARFKASAPELGLNKITVNDLVLFAVSRVLPLYPFMNAHKLGDVLRTFNTVHLGVAVSTPRGLMVPVLKNAQTLSLSQISAGAKERAEACRAGTISPDDLHGSTLTVTNLGNTGISSFTPVINVPEVAILGVVELSLNLWKLARDNMRFNRASASASR
jgi:pyruvate dehydrogenase E2 component (dihydrolipoamide acetyltransferase)